MGNSSQDKKHQDEISVQEIEGLHLFDEPQKGEDHASKAPEAQVAQVAQVQEDNDVRLILFESGGFEFATYLLQAKEVIETQEYRPVANTTSYFLGFANVRGDVVGLIDLNTKFNLPAKGPENRRALIVFDHDNGLFAMQVDRIVGVISIEKSNIDIHPPIKSRIPEQYLTAVAKMSDRFVSVVDLVKILNDDDYVTVRKSKAG